MLEPTPGDPNTLSGGGGGGGGPNKGLVDRVKDILMSPKTEWDVIDGESATIGGIYTSYVMILAAIPAVCLAIGLLFFMPRPSADVAAIGQAFGVPVMTTGSIILGAVVQYVLSLVGVYVMSMIIDALAPNFGGTKDPLKAFKVAAYYPTAAWVAGLLYIIPLLGLLALIAAIYSLYTLYLGLPKLMRVPKDKEVGYFVVTLVIAFIVFMIIGFIGNKVIYSGLI
jgi:Yip1 domain